MKHRPNARHYLFLLPALLIYATFILFPFAHTLFLSTHEWDGFSDPEFAGTANFIPPDGSDALAVANDEYLHRALLNNFLYWDITILVEVFAGLAMAALLVRVRRGVTFYRLALSAPLMISLVATAVLWRQILASRGILNSALTEIGLESLARNWLDKDHVVFTVSFISGWVFAGFYMLIFYSGLNRIPEEVREAARIDGAGEWAIFNHLELPLLRPVTAVCILLCSTGAFRIFDLFYVIVGTGRSRQTEVASTWLVKKAFTDKDFGYASAIAVVVVALVMGITILLNVWASRQKEYEY